MDRPSRRAFLVVLDGVGVGNAPDAYLFGDEGSDTLGNLARHHGGLSLPNLQNLGLGNLTQIMGVDPVENPIANHGRLEEISSGKDSIAGHWEICGLHTEIPFPTYADAFPVDVVSMVEEICGKSILGNEVASGTEIMDRLGDEHVRTGKLILYTSADSVLQLLAHEDVVPLEELYRICKEIHRRLKPPHRVGRVIARPFISSDGKFTRTSNRRDYAVTPPKDTILNKLQNAGYEVVGIGKVDTLFAGKGFSKAIKTKNNNMGIDQTLELITEFENGLVFTNLLDFDAEWGHRNDVDGFKKGMEEFDTRFPEWLNSLYEDDLMIITADHGNDPTTPSTDHSREHVPLLAWLGRGGNGKNLSIRYGFMDVAATIADHFRVTWDGPGKSFYNDLIK
jgi:phosphopentomutase